MLQNQFSDTPNLSDICGLKVKMLVLELGSQILNLIIFARGETINFLNSRG